VEWWRGREAGDTTVTPLTAEPQFQSAPQLRTIADDAADPIAVDLERLDIFTDVLERVLAREARRHGVPLDEEP
jgi:hypothetical protein